MAAALRRAMWLWAGASTPADAASLAAFAASRRVGEVFLSVPWQGPDASTRAIAGALRDRRVPVACLGGDPAWTDPALAVEWTSRATASGLFSGVHLDVELWTEGDPDTRLEELTRTIRAVAASTPLPVEVDLAPWLASEHPCGFAACARAAAAVTLMSYRDTAAGIIAWSADARRMLAAERTPHRLGVDTGRSDDPHTTFYEEGSDAMERELAAVAARLGDDPLWRGIAVHDAAGWRALRP